MDEIQIITPLEVDAATRAKIQDPAYWRNLNPGFAIIENPFDDSRSPYPVDDAEIAKILKVFRHDGYCVTSPIVPEETCDRLAECIKTVVMAGHHPCYALVYDEFYQLAMDLANLLTPLLGENYQFVPDEFGTYYIMPDDMTRGTPPHRDNLPVGVGVYEDGLPKICNAWVALTDTTSLNSCMYVLPGHCDPEFPQYGKVRNANGEQLTIDQSTVNLVRALPAKKGSVLCWSPQVLHWGAQSSRFGEHPRLSYAFYCQNRNEQPFHDATTDIPSAIPFERRIELIEKVWKKNL